MQPEATDQSEYIKILQEVTIIYVEDELLLKWVFQEAPKHTNKQQHLDFRPTRRILSNSWSKLQTLIQ